MSVMTSATRRDWENTYEAWAQPPGKTEQEKCDRAVSAIKQAIGKSDLLQGRSVTTFPQGSYRNRTNVRQDSDVDVCVLCANTFFYHLPDGVTPESIGIVPATYSYASYKSDVEQALVDHFGPSNLRRGNKAFDIHENTYRVDADAAACFEYRLYFYDSTGMLKYHKGTALVTDREGRLVSNFPEQQYNSGVAKNEATGRRFKKVVRILKRLRNEMEEVGVPQAEPVPSFLIECAAWNAPDELFAGSTLKGTVQDVLAHIWGKTKTDADCSHWNEENGIKRLFGTHQEWTREQLNAFAAAAWAYIEQQ